LPTIVRAI